MAKIRKVADALQASVPEAEAFVRQLRAHFGTPLAYNAIVRMILSARQECGRVAASAIFEAITGTRLPRPFAGPNPAIVRLLGVDVPAAAQLVSTVQARLHHEIPDEYIIEGIRKVLSAAKRPTADNLATATWACWIQTWLARQGRSVPYARIEEAIERRQSQDTTVVELSTVLRALQGTVPEPRAPKRKPSAAAKPEATSASTSLQAYRRRNGDYNSD